VHAQPDGYTLRQVEADRCLRVERVRVVRVQREPLRYHLNLDLGRGLLCHQIGRLDHQGALWYETEPGSHRRHRALSRAVVRWDVALVGRQEDLAHLRTGYAHPDVGRVTAGLGDLDRHPARTVAEENQVVPQPQVEGGDAALAV